MCVLKHYDNADTDGKEYAVADERHIDVMTRHLHTGGGEEFHYRHHQQHYVDTPDVRVGLGPCYGLLSPV
ncbi:MAG: hypothetical protein K2H15_05005 [Muribaculaceae bacterium]|nr:hypothetical protein [Muribaculaceae bacterium]